MEKKIELECDYCHSPLNIDSYKCPSCGADCSSKKKKYKEEKAKEDEIKKQERMKEAKAYQRKMKIPIIIFFSITVLIILASFIGVGIGMFGSVRKEVAKEESKEEYKVDCTYDSYEFYAFTSDDFPNQYNTPEGYQKIAFHLTCENKQDYEDDITAFDVHLTADDYSVELVGLEPGMFGKISEGSGNYPDLLNKRIGKGEKLQGYIGYLVPKNRKKLKLTICDKVIEMDNPAYENE